MRLFILVLAVGAVTLSACGDDADDSSSASSSSTGAAKDAFDVKISNFKFVTPDVAVKTGGTVTWTNDDSAAHTATDDKGAAPFDTGTLNQGDAKKVTFSKPGTYAYICAFHPFMKGTVVVQ